MRSTLCIALVTTTTTLAHADETLLTPAAELELPFRPTWSVALDTGGLLIAAESALTWTELRDGKLTHPIRVTETHSGPLWRAADRSGVGYAFDRYAVYAIELQSAQPPRLRWKIDDSAHFKPGEADDPEFLVRFRDVRPTPLGAVAIRSDGRLGLLQRETGRLVWQRKVHDMGDATLLSCGPTVALTQMQSHGLLCYMFNARRDPPTLEPALLGRQRTEINAMALVDSRLIVVRGSIVACLELGGSWTEAPLTTKTELRRVGTVDGRLCSFAPDALTLLQPTSEACGLETERSLVYPSNQHWKDWRFAPDRAWALRDPLDSAQAGVKTPPDRQREVATWSLSGDESQPAAVYRLHAPGGVATAAWSDKQLWLIADDRLYVYNLPTGE